jgi:outer membrane protein assembly factor BamC
VDGLVGDSKIDYRTQAKKTNPLEVPPDLTQLSREGRLSVPAAGAEVRASSLAAAAAAAPVSGERPVAPGAIDGMRIVRQGTQRWLWIPKADADALWPKLTAFWGALGFTLEVENRTTGVMETSWAENRAKLPQDMFRATLGRLLEGLYSTGERDRFRTRLERVDGGIEVYVSHRGMEEVYTTSAQERTMWQPRQPDVQLEAEMLARLMVHLGSPETAARQAVAQPKEVPPAAKAVDLGGRTALTLVDGFDLAWRRVGLALDRIGFSVEDRDRAAGLYFVRYVDPAFAGKEEPGFFSRLLGGKDKGPRVDRFRVKVAAEGNGAVVTLQSTDGAPETGEAAKRILEQLANELR